MSSARLEGPGLARHASSVRRAGAKNRGPGWRLLLGLTAAISLLTACDIFDLDSTRLVAGSVFQFPEIDTPAGGQSEVTLASVFFGQREPGVDVLTFPPVGIVGADVRLVIFAQGDSVRDVALFGLGDGTYTAASSNDDELVYRAGASYRVEVDELGEAFDVDAESAPSPEAPQGIVDGHSVGQPMTVSRAQMRIAFIEVLRFQGGAPFLTYTDRPETVQEILQVIADPSPYQGSSIEIPGSAFPVAGYYAVILTTAVRGVPDVNLYSGSGVLVGAGEARVFQVE